MAACTLRKSAELLLRLVLLMWEASKGTGRARDEVLGFGWLRTRQLGWVCEYRFDQDARFCCCQRTLQGAAQGKGEELHQTNEIRAIPPRPDSEDKVSVSSEVLVHSVQKDEAPRGRVTCLSLMVLVV
jgi:hypothetical protein